MVVEARVGDERGARIVLEPVCDLRVREQDVDRLLFRQTRLFALRNERKLNEPSLGVVDGEGRGRGRGGRRRGQEGEQHDRYRRAREHEAQPSRVRRRR
jgi:hypothetical protein